MSGLEFDPGFAPFILAFRGTVEYLYMDISRFKNLSQKKMKFRQYYKKMLDMFNNNLGFYVGCLMWAAYIKTQPEQEILNNNCLGQEYNEEENISDTEFMIKFLELLPKDVKYFLGQNYEINQADMKILELYKEFLEAERKSGIPEDSELGKIKLEYEKDFGANTVLMLQIELTHAISDLWYKDNAK